MKKRKFLSPLAASVAALLAVSAGDNVAAKAIEPVSEVSAKPKNDPAKVDPFVIERGEPGEIQTAYHRSHYSHRSHSSHYSHRSHYSSRW